MANPSGLACQKAVTMILGVLVSLLVVWAGLLLSSVALRTPTDSNTGRYLRMASSCALVIAAWGWFSLTDRSELRLLIAIGMSFGWLGDLYLAKFFKVPSPLIGGIGAFAIGHILYIVALLNLANAVKPVFFYQALLLALVSGLVGWHVVVWRADSPKTGLHWAGLVYTLLLAAMTGLTWGLALQPSLLIWLGVGGTLFLVSDTILSFKLFRGYVSTNLENAVWLTYGPAQMLLVYAFNLALSA